MGGSERLYERAQNAGMLSFLKLLGSKIPALATGSRDESLAMSRKLSFRYAALRPI
jgi:hypothetical protein